MAQRFEPKRIAKSRHWITLARIQLKQDFPHLTIAINGGVKSLEEAKEHLQHLDGVMIGREAYQSPYLLASVDQALFGSSAPIKKRRRSCKRCTLH